MKESRCLSKSQKREEFRKTGLCGQYKGRGGECGKKDEAGENRAQGGPLKTCGV